MCDDLFAADLPSPHEEKTLEQKAGALRDEVFGRAGFRAGRHRGLQLLPAKLPLLRDAPRQPRPEAVPARTGIAARTGPARAARNHHRSQYPDRRGHGGRPRNGPAADRDDPPGEPNLGISVCLGTLDHKLYDELRQAGASYYIIKLETGNRDHYREIAGAGHLRTAARGDPLSGGDGWSVSSGFILGLPGQTPEHIEETLDLLGKLPLAGASVSPFIAGEQTPFAGQPSGDFETTIRCIARLRLRNPSYIIPAISALNLVSEDGYVRALRAGANLATINLTPAANRTDYLLYKRDRLIMHEQRVKDAIEEAECAISTVSIVETLRRAPVSAARAAS